MQNKFKTKKSLSLLLTIGIIPLIAFLNSFLEMRKYYILSLVVVICAIILFFLSFENSKPHTKEVIVIAVMSAIAAVSRIAFAAIPFFKPLAAVVIICGVCLGANAGFICGAISCFASNFVFGQGPWTAWQMISFGLLGFLSGVIFYNKKSIQKKVIMSVYGALAVILLVGPILDLSGIFAITEPVNLNTVMLILLAGLPFNAVHSAATFLFVLILSTPLIEKLDRIKIKYGIMM